MAADAPRLVLALAGIHGLSDGLVDKERNANREREDSDHRCTPSLLVYPICLRYHQASHFNSFILEVLRCSIP